MYTNKIFRITIAISLIFCLNCTIENQIQTEKLYLITRKCIKCLEKTNLFSKRTLSLIRVGSYMTVNELVLLEEKKYRLLSSNIRKLNKNFSGYSAILDCLEVQEKKQQQQPTFQIDTNLEKNYLLTVENMKTDCSNDIVKKYGEEREEWEMFICAKFYNKEKKCIPSFIENKVQEYFNGLCFPIVGKKLFIIPQESEKDAKN